MLKIRQRFLPPDHADIARSFHEKLIDIFEKYLLLNRPTLACCQNNLGMPYEAAGECTKAHSSLKELVVFKQIHGMSGEYYSSRYEGLGSLYTAMKQYSEEFLFYEKATVILQSLYLSNNSILVDGYSVISSMYDKLESDGKTIEFYKKTLDILENHPSRIAANS
ncbi:unnamed protein product [Adineta ricciae]|uniref:Uncharacterized protein n=1 Tax=Adineta ricciae TaxID=249248 RepID=A0A815NAP6_ADIRI|nr:unnamed protein product [Adineta ricciae]CAF1431408.1 unnamed protein product [Adineta ricciae]